MSRPALLLLALASLLAAGCVAPAAQDVGAQAAPLSVELPHLELSDAHDHKDHASHRVAWNAEPLGWNAIAPDVTKLGRYNHVSLHGDTAFVSAYFLSSESKPGLAILDVSGDEPVLLGTLETPDMTPIDVWPSPDGTRVFLAGHRDNRATLPTLPGEQCAGVPAVITVCKPFVPAGVVMVDVTDPAAPKALSTYTSAPSGVHALKAHDVGGATYVFLASYGFSYADRIASGVEILKVEGDQMKLVTRFMAERPSGVSSEGTTFVHDVWIEEHPDGRVLMYVAYWDGGVVIADVSDPSKPIEVADWRDFDAQLYGNIHFVRPVGVIGDRHVTMAAPEFGSAEHAGEMYVLDTTDVSAPKLLSKWTLPGDPVNDGGYRFSPHNFAPMGSLVAYAHYHGGVWVLDLAVPETPEVKAYFFPAVPEGTPEFESVEDAPIIWASVWTERGTIVASDMGTGLHHWRMVSEDAGTPPYEG